VSFSREETERGSILVAAPLGQVRNQRLGTSARGFFQPRRLEGLRVGVISEDWPVWLEVLPFFGNYINPGMGEGSGFYKTLFRRDCTWLVYHFIIGKDITFKIGFGVDLWRASVRQSEVLLLSGRNDCGDLKGAR
jgi:hypothetical protein